MGVEQAAKLGLARFVWDKVEALAPNTLDLEGRRVREALFASFARLRQQEQELRLKHQHAGLGAVVTDDDAVVTRWMPKHSTRRGSASSRVATGEGVGYSRFRAFKHWQTSGCHELRDAAFLRPQAKVHGARAAGS